MPERITIVTSFRPKDPMLVDDSSCEREELVATVQNLLSVGDIPIQESSQAHERLP